MALTVTHAFVSAIADDPVADAAGEVVPSDWNAAHTVVGAVELNVANTWTANQTFDADIIITTDADHGDHSVEMATSGYGTPGTLTGVTADTTISSTSITLSAGHGITNGQYVTIGSMVGAFVLSAVGATSATLNRVATASLTGAAVQYAYHTDPELVVGYNLNSISDAAEPEWVMKFEPDWMSTNGYRHCEWYLQYTPVGGAGVVRPIMALVNRDLDEIVSVTLNTGTDALQIDNFDSSRHVAEFTDGTITLEGNLTTQLHPSGSGLIQVWKNNVPTQVASLGYDGRFIAIRMDATAQIGIPATSSVAILTVGDGTAASSVLTGSEQSAISVFHAGTTAATSKITGFRIGSMSTASAAYTVARMSGIYLGPHYTAGGSTITRSEKIYVYDDQYGTNNVAFQYGRSTTWTGNWALYFDNTSPSYHAGRFLIGTNSDDASSALQVAGNISLKNATNGQALGVKSLTELLTIAAAATSTTTIQMPANSIILAVPVRVTTAVTCTSTFTVGDAGSATRFSTAAVSKAANTTDKGTAAGAYYNATAEGIVITPDTVPSDATGRVRVTIYYIELTPPTS